MTLVPERRAELTTEGGLDVVGQRARVEEAVEAAHGAGLESACSSTPTPAGRGVGRAGGGGGRVAYGALCRGRPRAEIGAELRALDRGGEGRPRGGDGAARGAWAQLVNVQDVAAIPGMAELNIGHSIVSRAVFVGFERAVRDMIRAMAGRG